MASLTEEIADALAQDVIRASQELGDDNLVSEISKVIGASSTTTQEAFMTAVRVRLAEQRARRMLAERMGEEWMATLERAPAPPPPVAPAARPLAAPMRSEAAGRIEPVEATPPAAKPAAVAPASQPAASAPLAATAAPQAAAQRGTAQAPVPTPAVAAQAKVSPATSAPASAATAAAASAAPVPARPPKPEFQRIEAPVAAPVAQTLAAKLSLAAALPRRNVEPREAPTDNPDIEIPDGDWG